MQMRSTIRASDAEREGIAQRLRQAAVEGRLTAPELETRLHRCWRAQTLGQLDALVMDLPGGVLVHGRRLTPTQAVAAGLLVLTAPAWFPLLLVGVLLFAVMAVALGPHLWTVAEVLVALMIATSFFRGRVRRRRRLH
ncbi:MAG: DUF1707 domain-containing protein [Solirubrobacterales bacterium]|nr:DUF1707 domain-containing protein [Solirubrobacterales bacterium]